MHLSFKKSAICIVLAIAAIGAIVLWRILDRPAPTTAQIRLSLFKQKRGKVHCRWTISGTQSWGTVDSNSDSSSPGAPQKIELEAGYPGPLGITPPAGSRVITYDLTLQVPVSAADAANGVISGEIDVRGANGKPDATIGYNRKVSPASKAPPFQLLLNHLVAVHPTATVELAVVGGQKFTLQLDR